MKMQMKEEKRRTKIVVFTKARQQLLTSVAEPFI